MEKKDLMIKFFNAFQNGDYKTMISMYHPDVIFEDDLFGTLDYDRVTNMWKMLFVNKDASDYSMTYNIEEKDSDVYAEWTASYLLGKKKRRVINNVTSHMEFKDDKIIKHTDSFSFDKWARQAINETTVALLGSKLLHRKVSKEANKKLEEFIESNKKDFL